MESRRVRVRFLMAGDWIPFYVSTPRKSEVLQIARETGRSRHEVLGLLLDFWAWVQCETRDRLLPRLKCGDVCVAVGGDDAFWMAVEQVGWVTFTAEGIEIPNADEWLSKGAKSRLLKSQRQKRWRENKAENVDVPVDAQPSTRVEKSKEEKKSKRFSYSSDFETFWEAFPKGRKTGKRDAFTAWQKAVRDTEAETIIAAASEYASSDVGQGEYVKGPAPWLRAGCWEDDRSAWAAKNSTIDHAEATDTARRIA